MNTIKLPAEFQSGNSVPVERATITRQRMAEILAEAIEADRQARDLDQCVPLSTDGTAVFIDGIGEVSLDFSGKSRGEPVADCYSNDSGDTWKDCHDDIEFVHGLKVGDEYELEASVRAWSERFRVTKVPDEKNDDYEVEPVSIRAAPQPQQIPDGYKPSVPEPLKYGGAWKDHYVTGWNNCRAAMLEAAPQPTTEKL